MTFDIPDGKHWEHYYLGRDDVSSKPLQIVNIHGLQATIAAGSSSWLISSLKRNSMVGAVVDLTLRPTNRTGLIADIAISPLYPEVKIIRFSVDVCNSEGAFCATIPKTSAFVLKLQPKCRLQLNFTDSVETVRVSVCLDRLVANYLSSVVGRINLSWNFKEAPQLPKPQEVLSAVKSGLTSIEVTCYGDAYACNRVKEELAVAVAEYFKSIKFDSYRKAIILNGEKKQVPLYRVVREGIIVWELK